MLVDEPQNLVSYHLRLLRDGGLVTARRSSADGRDSYYAIDLDACRTRCRRRAPRCIRRCVSPRGTPFDPRERASRRRPRVLFLCTGNSARSQIAEALLEHMSAGAVDAGSAGSHPKPLHPNAVRVMRKRGIDISANRTKHLDEFALRAVRHGDHPVRPGSRGVPAVPVAPRTRPLERSRPGTRGLDEPRDVPGVRAHRRRARDPHRLSSPPAHRRQPTRRTTHAQR